MDLLQKVKFSFVSQAMPADTFAVVSFTGTEGLSKLYRFDINLVSENPDLDFNQVLQHPVVFTIHREDGSVPFNGVLASFVQEHGVGDYYFYRAVLVPRLWWLTMSYHNQIFLDKSVPEIIRGVFEDAGLLDYEFRLKDDYQPVEYVCQYKETHFNFISHWMERNGLYYFFEQTDKGEKVIVTDTGLSHLPTPQNSRLIYNQSSDLEHEHWVEIIMNFSCTQQMVPQAVMVKDYNYRLPTLDLTGQADVSPENGRGKTFVYGDHFRTPEEGNRLAGIRAEGYLCREKVFSGSTSIPYLIPGYTFTLENHFRSDYNQPYLIMELSHQGVQGGYLISGLKSELSEAETRLHYSNTFSACPASVQYRPEHITPKAGFHGVINAKIDAEGSGQYAELDDQGRYKVVMPFDLSGRKDGKASAWLRMAQPYAGSNHGMHFPLHKDTEVLVIFIDGDPDRPIISGAVPNPESASVVTNDNQTMAQIITGGQNKIHMNDQEGNERIMLHTPGANTIFRIGAPNDPPSWFDWKGTSKGSAKENYKENGVLLSTEGPIEFQIGQFKIEVVAGAVLQIFAGVNVSQNFAFSYDGYLGGLAEVTRPFKLMFADTVFDSGLDNVTKRVTALENNNVFIQIDGQNTSIGDKFDQLATNIDRVTNTTNTLTNDKNTMNRTLTDLNQTVTNLSSTVTNVYKTKINDIVTEVKKVGTSLKDIQVSQVTEETTVQQLGTQVQNAQTKVKNLGTSIHNANLTVIN